MQILTEQLQSISISDLHPHPDNANRGDIQAIRESIETNGFYGALLVQKSTGFILSGNHRYEAAKSLGATCLPVIYVDVTEQQARKILVADNRTTRLGQDDPEMLTALLQQILQDGELTGTGYTTEDLDQLLADITQNPTKESHPDPQSTTSLQEAFLAPPFSTLDTRQGYWMDRKRAWLAIGLQSHLGREDELAFAKSSQPPSMYDLRNEMRAERGHDPTWDEVIAEATRLGRYIAPGTSIFDPVLCELIYLWFAPHKAQILDPFAGGSVRGVVAAALGHQYTGIDLRAEQVEANTHQWQNLQEKFPHATPPHWINGDSRNIPTLTPDLQADLVFSCPPYFDLEVYSDNPDDLSNADNYDDFRAAYQAIIQHAVHRLKDNRFAVFVISDVRGKNGHYVGLLQDTIEAFTKAGAPLYNEMVLINQASSAAIRARRMFTTSRKAARTHQNILVFYKGDPREIRNHYPEISIMEIEENPTPDEQTSP